MRRIIFPLLGVATVAAFILGCAAPAQASAPAHVRAAVHKLDAEAPECITVNVRHHRVTWRAVEFCGSGPWNTPSGDSPLRDVEAGRTILLGWRTGWNCVVVRIDENSGQGPVIRAPFCGPGDSPMRDAMAHKLLVVDGSPLQSGAVVIYEG
jgi:hypothetical protein